MKTWRGIPAEVWVREWVANLLMAGFYAWGARNAWLNFMAYGKLSSLLFVLFELVVIVIFLFRRFPTSSSQRPVEWVVAFAATTAPLFLLPSAQHEIPVIVGVQVVGILISFAGLLSLNKSFGIIPANRGIKKAHLYRWVRHPIYAGYVVSNLALVANHLNPHNLGMMGVFLALLILRIGYEERFLSQDTEYAAYKVRTRWRLIPGVW
jgi:protein-S-isoprenylcysteine O-methyltransferase Ste14